MTYLPNNDEVTTEDSTFREDARTVRRFVERMATRTDGDDYEELLSIARNGFPQTDAALDRILTSYESTQRKGRDLAKGLVDQAARLTRYEEALRAAKDLIACYPPGDAVLRSGTMDMTGPYEEHLARFRALSEGSSEGTA